tara:strand:- start:147725 stop:148819 length:1095 start_codon:yes stop_codon:yes gene_type:complete
MSPQERVNQTIDAMESAIIAGDPGAYMARIDSDDVYFVHEQRAWVNDLSRNPVSKFSIEPLEELIVGITGRAGMMRVRMHWTLKADEIERTIEMNAIFYPMGDEPDGPWLFAGRGWGMKLESDEGLRVRSDREHQELALSVLEIAPEIASRIEQDFGRTLSEPLTIKIYPTMQALQFSIAPGYLDPLSGWNEPGESIKILGRDSMSVDRISTLLAHEIGHAVSFEFGEDIIDAPWWSLEGIAELVADDYRSTPPEKRIVGIAQQVARGDRRSWDQLSDFKGEALNHTMYVYAQGWSMVRYITGRFGRKARNQWFAAMGDGMDVDQATQHAFKMSFDDLDRAWEQEMLSIAEQADVDAAMEEVSP